MIGATACTEIIEVERPPLPLAPTFFGLDLQYGHGEPYGTPWPNDAGFTGHQNVRLWLAGGGLWADVQAAGRGAPFDWTAVDAYLGKAKQYPETVTYVIAMTPTFAVAPEHRSTLCAWPTLYPGGCNPPDDWDEQDQGACLAPAAAYEGPNCTFKEYLVGLVRRYRATGTQDGCPATDPQCHGVIHTYELWNEVDSYDWPHTRFWAGQAAGEATDGRANAYRVLGHMVRDAAEVIRSEDPAARIIGPSFTGYDGTEDFEVFYEQDLSGLAEAVDVLSFHGYWEPEAEHEPEVTREMVQAYVDARENASAVHAALGTKPLWDTEGGWGMSHFAPCQAGEGPCIHDPDRQTAYLARWFLHHWDLGVENATWFHWGTNGWGEIYCPEGAASEDHNVGCGALPSDDFQLTGAGVAFQELRQWLTGSLHTGFCDVDGGIWSCGLDKASLPVGYGLILWSEGESPEDVQVPNEYTRYQTLDGATHDIEDHRVPVGMIPIFVQ